MIGKKIFQFLAIFGIGCSFGQTKEKSLFWEISGNGLKDKSYIYGTMHTGDERVYAFKPQMEKAFKKADILALELNMDSVNQMAVMSKLLMDDDKTLTDLLSEEDYSLIETYFKDSLSQSIAMYNRMQPIFTSSIIGTKDLGNQKGEALDMYFFKEAKSQKKTVRGLEKMDEQVGAFNSIPYDAQAKTLLKSVQKAYETNRDSTDEMDQMMNYYIAGDLEKLAALTDEVDKDDPELSKLFTEVFLTKRNHNMADRSVPLMREGSTFIAVGAAHLGGKEGVIQLLRDKGYKVVAK